MKIYNLGATAVVWATWKDPVSHALYDPTTSITCTIYLPGNTADVSAAAMTKYSTGIYYYKYQTAGKSIGEYKTLCTATDGTDITIKSGNFEVQ